MSDRKDAKFPIVTDQNCRMHILNAHDLSMLTNIKHMESIGVGRLRLDARNYTNEETAPLVTLYKEVLRGDREDCGKPAAYDQGALFPRRIIRSNYGKICC